MSELSFEALVHEAARKAILGITPSDAADTYAMANPPGVAAEFEAWVESL